MTSPLATAPGSTLGRYQVLKHLASGGMAELYLARATGIEGFERYVVVKKILGDYAKDARFVKMFLDEARLAAQLHHQNIAQVYDCGQDDGTYYFAMEYVHGENVRDVLKKVATLRKQIPLEHTLTMIAGAAAGLHHAHERRGADRLPLGIVHRDVSPSNLLVAYDGAVKVVDFGIAKAASRMTETRSGTLKGKIAYMSPEQCLGRAVDRRSDVFALGIVLYELSTVSRLFKGENDYITMNRIVTGDIAPPSKKRPDYPPGLEAIVMKALSLDAADRYQTAGEMLEAIEQFCARERIALSAIGLGRYIRELFGERPEPWVELRPAGDDLEVVEVTRSEVGSGVTGMPTTHGTPLPPAIGAGSASGAGGAAGARASTASDAGPRSQSLVLATSGSSVQTGAGGRRGTAWIVAGLVAAVAVVIGFAIGRRGDRGGGGGPGMSSGASGASSGASGASGASPSAAAHGDDLTPAPAGASGSAASGSQVGSAASGSQAGSAASGSPGSASGSQPGSGGDSLGSAGSAAGSSAIATDPGKLKARSKTKPPVAVGKGTGTKAKIASPDAGTGAGSASGSAALPQRDPTLLFPPKDPPKEEK